MSKIFQLEGGQYEHPNEYKLVGTVRGTTILQPEFGTVIIEGDVIEASTHNTIQKNGVLASKVNVTMESADTVESTGTVLVPTDMTIESDLFNELKIILLFETGTTLPSNSFIKLKETNVPIANVNDYIVNANTPLLFLYFDSKFYAYKAGSGTSTGASKLDDLSDVVVTSPIANQTLVYNGTNFVNKTVEEPAGSSKTQNGYQKLPSGVILQWGTVDYASNPEETPVDVVFPLVFPTSCLNVTATRKIPAGSSGDGTVSIVSYSSGSVRFQLDTWGGGAKGFTWFAIGY